MADKELTHFKNMYEKKMEEYEIGNVASSLKEVSIDSVPEVCNPMKVDRDKFLKHIADKK